MEKWSLYGKLTLFSFQSKHHVTYQFACSVSHSLLSLPQHVCMYVCVRVWVCARHPRFCGIPNPSLDQSGWLSGWLPWLPHPHLLVAPIMADIAGNKWIMWTHTHTVQTSVVGAHMTMATVGYIPQQLMCRLAVTYFCLQNSNIKLPCLSDGRFFKSPIDM